MSSTDGTMRTLITEVDLYTGLERGVQNNGFICIGVDGRIENVGYGEAPPLSDRYRHFRGGGYTAIHGLIDMLTHAMGGAEGQMLRGRTTAVIVEQAIHGISN